MTTYHPPTHWAPPAPPPPSPPRSPLVAVLVTALVAGLVGLLLGVAGTLAVQSLTQDDDGPSAAADGRPAAQVAPQRVPGLVAWIEERTGETFRTRPEVTVLPDEEFEEVLLAPVEGEEGLPASLPTDDWTSTVAALGLVADADAYDRWNETGFAGDVVGFYDQQAEAIWLRDTAWGPSMEVTLLHELVHALQDQVVDLDAVQARTRSYDESYVAFHSVVEGQATVLEEDWLAEQDEQYVDEYWADVPGGQDEGAAPEPLGEAMAALPYDVGWWGVVVLEEEQGTPAVFDALREPPTTLEQLWDMAAWADDRPAAADPVLVPDVAAPQGAEVVDRGSLGVHVLSLLTLEPEGYLALPGEDRLPLSGWAGDAYVTWEQDGVSCTQVQVVADDEEAALALADDLGRFDAEGGTLGVEGERVVLGRCTS